MEQSKASGSKRRAVRRERERVREGVSVGE
jgi:hypothetical protein